MYLSRTVETQNSGDQKYESLTVKIAEQYTESMGGRRVGYRNMGLEQLGETEQFNIGL